jgi:hypothetical protein
MTFALIENGIVTNNIVLDPKDLEFFPNAICSEGIPINIGDIFNSEDGYFYHEGERLLSLEEKLFEAERVISIILGGN